MIELMGNETEYEQITIRIVNLQEQLIQNYSEIKSCYQEISRLNEENKTISDALKHWKKKYEKYYEEKADN